MALLKANTGIGTTNPTSALHVFGDGLFTGVVTATTFSGHINSGVGTFTNLTATNATLTNINSSGITTLGVTTVTRLTAQSINSSGIVTGSTFRPSSGYIQSPNGTNSFYIYDGTGNVAFQGTIGASQVNNSSGFKVIGFAGTDITFENNARIAGVTTSVGGFVGNLTGTATTATKLQNARTFEITGDILASPISFDGTGNVSLAATIQPNSVALGSDTTGDYVQSVSGTTNQITVTGGTGEGSTPVIAIANNATLPGNVTIANDLQVNNNLNVTGNITIGGTTAYVIVNDFRVKDADIVLGFTTDSSGNDVSNDTTANHGGIAVASTVGNPLVQIYNPGIGESTPATYKKIMWFQSGAFAGLNTDAWLINYAVGIGSTQFPSGTRLAAGSVQFTERDLAIVRNINASGIITAVQFIGTASTASFATTAYNLTDAANITTGTINAARLSGTYNINISGNAATATYATSAGVATYASSAGIATYATNAGVATYATSAGVATYASNAGVATYASASGVSTSVIGGIASVTQLSVSGISTLGVVTATQLYVSGVTTSIGGFVGNLTGTASTASFATTSSYLSDANNILSGTINVARLTGTYDININGNATTANYATNSGISTNVIGGIASVTSLNVSGVTTLGITSATNLTVQQFNASGIATVESLQIGATQVISSARQLQNIASLDATTTATIEAAIQNASNTFTDLQVTGISTLGVTSTTNLTTQQLSVSGISTFAGITTHTTSLFGTQASFTGVVTASSFSGNASSATYATNAGIATYATTAGIATYATNAGIATYATNAGIATYASNAGVATYASNAGVSTSVVGGIGSLTQLNVSGDATVSGLTTTNNLYVAGVGTFLSSGLKIRNPANTFQYNITGGAIVADRVLNLPVITATDTVATLGLSQSFGGTQTFTGVTINSTFSAVSTLSLTGSTTGAHFFGSSQTSGSLTFGGTSGTGLITFGRATTSQQTDIQAGATASGNTKTINFGTGGLSGSNTLINIGPTAGVGTVTLNAGTNLGIGSATPTSALDVIGGAKFTGVVTASSFSGNASSATYATNAGIATYASNAGISTNLKGGSAGNVPYQSAVDTTAFVSNGVSGQVLLFNGSIPIWGNVNAASGAFGGISVQDEGTPVGTANSIATLNFVSPNLSVTATSGANGIATITMSNNIVGSALSISGISTLGTVQISSGIVTATSGIVTYYGDGSKLQGIVSVAGIAVQDEGSQVGTSVTTLNFSGASVSVSNAVNGISTVTVIESGIATYATNAGIATYASNAGIATYATTAGIATYATNAGIATYASNAGIATYATTAGIATYATTAGIATYATTAGVATALQNARNFSITGSFVTAAAISFDGTGNVALAATITPDSIGLGTYTTGDYVKNISGTSNQITVTGGTGEGSTPTLSLPNTLTAPQDVTVTRDLQVNRNLNVNGNITIGGTAATIFSSTLNIFDPDIVLGYRTDANGNDIATDNTANHGGIAIASTEGTPLVQLFIAGIETNPATYKKIMWFKSGTFAGLNTDAWLSNYAIGIGSTQFPTGTRLAAGSVQFTENDLAVVRNINASGVVTASSFSGNASSATYATSAGIATYAISSGIATYATSAGIATYSTASGISTSVIGGIGSVTQLQVTGISTFSNGPVFIGAATSTGTASQRLQVTGGGYFSGSVGVGTTNPLQNVHIQGNLLVAAGSSTGQHITQKAYELNSGTLSWEGSAGQLFSITNNLTSGSIFSVNDISGIPSVDVNADGTVTLAPYADGNVGIATTRPTSRLHVIGDVLITGVVTASSFSGNASSATYATSSGIATYATTAGIATYASTAGISTYATTAGIATYASTAGIATNVIGGIASVTQLQVTGIATVNSNLIVNGNTLVADATNNRVGILTTSPLGALQVGAGTSTFIVNQVGTAVSVGVGITNPAYIFTVTDTGTLATVGLTNCLADFTTTANSYGQINLRNTSTGTNASADIIITADNGSDTTNFIDLGINNSGFSVGSWTINGANDGYLYTSDGNLSIGAINASVPKYISFFTGGTLISNERMRVNSTGVGIGTTNPQATLQVGTGITMYGATGIISAVSYRGDGSQLTGVSGGLTVTDDTSTNATRYVLFDDSTSGTVTSINVSSTKLTFNPSTGNLVAGGTVTANSDRKLKTDVQTIENALEKVLSLRGVEFTRIDNGDKQIGVIAQEVEEIIPEVVYPKQSVQNDETKSVAYGNIVGLLIEAIKEQNKEIQELKRRLEEG